jgi:hypothetical protein
VKIAGCADVAGSTSGLQSELHIALLIKELGKRQECKGAEFRVCVSGADAYDPVKY